MILVPFILLALLGIGFFFVSTNTQSGGSDLTDVDPADQGGSWDTQFDDHYSTASSSYGVPFALIKAHAIRESNQNQKALRNEPGGHGRPPSASYGLMQILWWKGSNRFAKYGYTDDQIRDGSLLYDPRVNTLIAAGIIKENLRSFGNLRDAINAYNTGVSESERSAPNNYVNDVISYYNKLTGR